MTKFPRTLVLLNGSRVRVVKVWYQYAKGVYRVQWYDGKPKGCLAYVEARLFREISQDEVMADVRKSLKLKELR